MSMKKIVIQGKYLSNYSQMLNHRKRLSFSGIFTNEGFHMENVKSINERRAKINIFRNFIYLGPRGEIFYYFILLLGINRIIKNNFKREKLEQNLNDNNAFLQLRLPIDKRIIETVKLNK